MQRNNRNNRKNRKNDNKAVKFERKLNSLFRKNCCWNCFQVGHKRFQCPYPKIYNCSFCRRPSVLSVECGCELSRQQLAPRRFENGNQITNYNENIMVPVNQPNGSIEYQPNENLMVVIENEMLYEEISQDVNDDVLEIHAESDSLSDI